MNVLRAVIAIQNAKRLLKVINDRKALEKEEKELKAFFLPHFDGDSGVLKCGEILVTKETKNRTDFNRELVKAELGDRLPEFQKATPYVVLDCKPC